MTRKALPGVLAVLLALAVGFILGTGRSGSTRAATAGPTEGGRGWGGDGITSNAEGTSLTVWKMQDGECVEARSYHLSTHRQKDDEGELVDALKVEPRIWSVR